MTLVEPSFAEPSARAKKEVRPKPETASEPTRSLVLSIRGKAGRGQRVAESVVVQRATG